MTTEGHRNRSAAVTGAGSGLGRDIALGLAAKGYRVFGTAMSSEEIADLEKASGGAVNLTANATLPTKPQSRLGRTKLRPD